MKNLFDDLRVLPEEITDVLIENRNVRVERIVSNGQTSPEGFWYDQDENEWVIVLQGEAALEFEDRTFVHMKPGDYLLIPARQKHRVSFTKHDQTTLWLAVFYRD